MPPATCQHSDISNSIVPDSILSGILSGMLSTILSGTPINRDDAIALFDTPDSQVMHLFALANSVRAKLGNTVDLCSISNARCGMCGEDCSFCAQSVFHNANITTHPLLAQDELVNLAHLMQESGAGRFCIVTSGGQVDGQDFQDILSTIRRIRKETRLSICASIGSLSREKAEALRDAGVSRIHHNLETSESFFSNICTTHTYADRLETVRIAKDAGFNVCCGGIIGMGESATDRVDMAFDIKGLDVDSVPLNILVPVKGTRLENITPIRPLDILKTIAVFRLILPDKTIRIAGGREANLRDVQALALMAGANGLIIGNYLTTEGRTPESDLMMIKDLGLDHGQYTNRKYNLEL